MKRKLSSRLLRYTWDVKRIFFLGLLCTFLTVGLDLLAPYLIAKILESELIESVGARDYTVFIKLIGVVTTTYFISSFTRFYGIYLPFRTANRISQNMQVEAFEKLQHLPISYFDHYPAGKIVSRITNDTKDIRQLYSVVLSQLLMTGVYVLGVYITLFSLDMRLFIMALVPIPILILVFWDYRKKSLRYNRIYRRELSSLNSSLNENIQAMEIIQSFHQEEMVLKEFETVNQAVYEQGINIVKLESYSSHNASYTLQYLTIAAFMLLFGLTNISGKTIISLGYAYIFIDYMIKIFQQANQALQKMGPLQKAVASAEHFFELLDQPVIEDRGKDIPLENFGISFKNVNFSYDGENPVLKDLSFTIEPGQMAAFVGHTGSGKSTIMNLIMGFYPAYEGEIFVGKRELKNRSLKSIRENMGIILQDPHIFSASLHENISLYDSSITKENSKQAIIDLGAEEFLEKLPDGVDTKLSERGSSLSAGERQLVSFARALVRDPRILILDEATANIDSETEQLIQEAMERLKKGRTTIVIAHRLSTIRESHQIFVLKEGRLIETGNHDELRKIGGIYESMYRDQS